MRPSIWLTLLLGCWATPPANAATAQTLEQWVSVELVPDVVEQFASQVRFQNDVVRFVVLDEGRPSARSNSLAIAVRDQLQDAVVERSSVRVNWQVNRERFDRFADRDRVDCTTSIVHYYVGVEIHELPNQRFEATVRALDVEEQQWLTGFGGNWSGTLTTAELRSYRQTASDQAWLGQRSVPFDESQSDLLASQIAHELGCALLREMSGEYVTALAESAGPLDARILQLVSHNLAPYQALHMTESTAGSNSIISASAHPVNDDLYQYWVTITPTSDELPALSASAYVLLPEQYLEPALVSGEKSAGLSNDSMLLSSLEVVQLHDRASCASALDGRQRVYDGSRGIRRENCVALQAVSKQDSVVFFLYHQLNNGLVRLAGNQCSDRANARIARHNERVLMALAIDAGDSPSWLPGDAWMVNPADDTFYVIAVSDTKAARAISSHIEKLPRRCGGSLRPGIDGAVLKRWFRELDDISTRWRTQVDWQSVRVKSVY